MNFRFLFYPVFLQAVMACTEAVVHITEVECMDLLIVESVLQVASPNKQKIIHDKHFNRSRVLCELLLQYVQNFIHTRVNTATVNSL